MLFFGFIYINKNNPRSLLFWREKDHFKHVYKLSPFLFWWGGKRKKKTKVAGDVRCSAQICPAVAPNGFPVSPHFPRWLNRPSQWSGEPHVEFLHRIRESRREMLGGMASDSGVCFVLIIDNYKLYKLQA